MELFRASGVNDFNKLYRYVTRILVVYRSAGSKERNSRMTERMQVIKTLMTLSLLLAGAAGCAGKSPTAQATVPPTPLPAPTIQSGWETQAASAGQGQCGYAIDHPS